MKRLSGFTLIEILVAFILLGLVGSLLLQLFQGGLRNIGVSAEQSHAALLARSKMTELLAAGDLRAGQRSGSYPDGYRWTLDLSPYQGPPGVRLPESALRPLHARLTLAWGDERAPDSFVTETLYLTGADE